MVIAFKKKVMNRNYNKYLKWIKMRQLRHFASFNAAIFA